MRSNIHTLFDKPTEKKQSFLEKKRQEEFAQRSSKEVKQEQSANNLNENSDYTIPKIGIFCVLLGAALGSPKLVSMGIGALAWCVVNSLFSNNKKDERSVSVPRPR